MWLHWGEHLPMVHKAIWVESQHHIYKPCTVDGHACNLSTQETGEESGVQGHTSTARPRPASVTLVSTKPNKQPTIKKPTNKSCGRHQKKCYRKLSECPVQALKTRSNSLHVFNTGAPFSDLGCTGSYRCKSGENQLSYLHPSDLLWFPAFSGLLWFPSLVYPSTPNLCVLSIFPQALPENLPRPPGPHSHCHL